MSAVLVTTFVVVVVLAEVLWGWRSHVRWRERQAVRRRDVDSRYRRYRIAALERELGIGDPYPVIDGRRVKPLEPPAVDWQPR